MLRTAEKTTEYEDNGGETKCCPCYLLGDETGNDVSSVNINRAHGHDFLPVARAQFSEQQANQRVQLRNLG